MSKEEKFEFDIANLKKEYKDRDGGYSDYVLEYYEKLFSIALITALTEPSVPAFS